jgi:hypothetical protein
LVEARPETPNCSLRKEPVKVSVQCHYFFKGRPEEDRALGDGLSLQGGDFDTLATQHAPQLVNECTQVAIPTNLSKALARLLM